ncbi:TPA: hypothetical protein ACH3X2_003071 [Trebouxia sp. C0005]
MASKMHCQAYPIRRPKTTTSLGITVLHLEKAFVHRTSSLQLIASSQSFFKLQLLQAPLQLCHNTHNEMMQSAETQRVIRRAAYKTAQQGFDISAMQVGGCKVVAHICAKLINAAPLEKQASDDKLTRCTSPCMSSDYTSFILSTINLTVGSRLRACCNILLQSECETPTHCGCGSFGGSMEGSGIRLYGYGPGAF